MIPKKHKYRHEEKQIDIVWMGRNQKYDVMLIEDKDYLYAVIDTNDAVTSPVNITHVLSSQRILEPDFWVYIDHRMAMEDTQTSNFQNAPDDLVSYYFQHRENDIPLLTLFDIESIKPNQFTITLNNDTVQCIIDIEFKDIYLDKNHLFESGFKDVLHAAVYEILNINPDFFVEDVGKQWLSQIFSTQNPFLGIHLWNALPIKERTLMISSGAIPTTLLHKQKNSIEDQLFL